MLLLHGDHARVLIIGAGPAGLVLGNLLRAQRIDCVILERRSREHVEHRARAGFLAANSVRILDENGLAAGLHKHGQQHDTCAFRSDHVTEVHDLPLDVALLRAGRKA